MAIQVLNNGDLGSTQRKKINDNFSELNTNVSNLKNTTDTANTDISNIQNILNEMQNGDKYIQKTTVKKISTGEDIPSTLEEGELYFQLF